MEFTINNALNMVKLLIIFIIAKKYYEYNKENEAKALEKEENRRIKDLEFRFKIHSDYVFYITVFKILVKNHLITEFINLDKMMEDTFILYHDDDCEFRDECYTHGIRPRFLEYMKKNKKNI